ncbi:unnamed protein product [Paramecium sonneborni]|uniref:Transmembrane protein n=1 Tax=Paramecium sonneborni TaxID=65129 RepID=A0A8S1PJV1_9CILI|nr:unnamed protein product [Paramecium sonneborni]
MKFIYLVILGITIGESRNSFSFLLNPKEIYNRTLQFKTNYLVNQISLRCDNLTYDAWRSQNYTGLEVSPEQRRTFECTDTNFTLTVSNDFNYDEIVISVFDAYFKKEIAKFNFLSENYNVQQNTLSQNSAQLATLNYVDNDFKITVYNSQFIYMEIIKCSNSYSHISVKGYDQNYLYHNVSGLSYRTNVYYDVISGQQGNYYYRLSQNSYYSPDVFIKYQIASQVDFNYIKEYANKDYYVYAQVRQGKINIQVPAIKVLKNENVEFHVVVSNDAYENDYLACVQGDETLQNQYGTSYISELSTFSQNYNYGKQDIQVNFPNQESGWYNVRITAIVDHGSIKQTIPFDKLLVYQDYIVFPDTLLVHVLAPIIISCIALIGLIVGACKFSAKKKKLQQQELLQLYQNNLNNNLQIQSHPQY